MTGRRKVAPQVVLNAVVTVMLAACFHPTYDEPLCASGDCPSGFSCVQGICRRDGDAVDASDAEEIDAVGEDAIDAPDDAAALIDGPPIDGTIDGPPIVDDVVHVRAVDEVIGTGDLTVSSTLTITTSGTPAASMMLPSGVTLEVVPQDGSGNDLVVLRVQTLSVGSAGVLRATGGRPLVILAESVVLDGWIDVSASGVTLGAGALVGGPGAGSPGGHLNTFADSGGGGGSFGGLGADGGDAVCNLDCDPNQTLQGGARGATYGTATLTILEGGSPGGRSFFGGGAACMAGSPGGGGGAVQVFARSSMSISVAGGIAAGGGGGDGGDHCTNPFNWLAGHGGGSGGAIYLQTPSLQNNGLLVANGGGGGGGSGEGGDGDDGTSAGRSAQPGAGGATDGSLGAAGGDGARQATPAEGGGLGQDRGNGGGGGGGMGRIHARTRMTPAIGASSPTATTSTY